MTAEPCDDCILDFKYFRYMNLQILFAAVWIVWSKLISLVENYPRSSKIKKTLKMNTINTMIFI